MSDCLVSIICPIYQEEKYIEKCISTILEQDYPIELLEVLFVDGMSLDRTREIVYRYSSKYQFIKLLDNPYRVVPHAMNIGYRASKGDVIIRIDGHCEYPSNYVSTLVKYLFKLNADNVGALWNTMPANDTAICQSIAIASSHPFGVGASKHKIGTDKIIETDTVPFGCYKREVFERIGLFDEDLIRNQDDEFNARLINAGGKIYLIPHLIIDYIARDKFSKMCKMYFQYGLFKPLVNKKLGSPATVRQFFPLLFLLGIIIGGLLSLFSVSIAMLYFGIISLYILLTITISTTNAFKHKQPLLIFLLPITFFMIHMSYGYGYLVGLFKILTKQPFVVKSNR